MDETDGSLLAAFGQRGDERSFATLVGRHQRMVYNACRRTLRQDSDAEDATQAVFLALAHKAGDTALWSRTSLAGWLYEAAWHVSTRMREAADVRKRREKEAANMHERLANTAAQWAAVAPMLDGELNELPEKYRMPIILHHLEQRSVEETAGLMQCSTDAAKQRLCRGREMLKGRLERRGVVLPAGAFAALLTAKACAETAGPALALKGAASGPVAALAKYAAEATARPLLIRRWAALRVAGAVAAVCVIAAGALWVFDQGPAKQPRAPEEPGKEGKGQVVQAQPQKPAYTVFQGVPEPRQALNISNQGPIGQAAFDPAHDPASYSNAARKPEDSKPAKPQQKEDLPFPPDKK